MSTSQQDLTSFQKQTRSHIAGPHAELHESIERVRSKLKADNRLDAEMLDLDGYCDAAQTIFKQLKEMLTKTLHLHDELERKAAQAALINKSIADLPGLFDEMIEHFQSSEARLLVKWKEDLTKLGEEIEQLEVDLAATESRIAECVGERKEQQVNRVRLDEELAGLVSKLSVSLNELNELKQTNDKLNGDACRSADENRRIQRDRDQLNSSLTRIEKEKTELKTDLEEKVARFSELKGKKQCLLSGAYADEEIKKLKTEIDKKREELTAVQQSIEEIKYKAAKPSQPIKLPRLRDQQRRAHVKALLIRLSKLIELNYQHQYMVFPDHENPAIDS